MGSLHDRCSLHPQRRVVGICANCLHERLTLLIESISPEDVLNDGEDVAGETHHRQISNYEPKWQPPPRAHRVSHERSASNFNPSAKTSTEMARHSYSHAKLEDSLSLALQKVKHAHQQLSYVAQSPYQGEGKLGPSASPLIAFGASEKNGSTSASQRQSNTSEPDLKMFPAVSTEPSGKRRGSWFSISRGKNSLVNSPLPPNAGKLDEKNCSQKSPQVKILAGRKSASDAISGSCNNYRQAYMADLESIAEINLGEAAIKVESNEGDVHTNPSWISSLFHRRKGSRYKSYERQDAAGINNSASDAKAAPFFPETSVNRSPMPALEAGRLSWDGPRPSFKQLLKKIEARKKQQRVDCSPMHNLAAAADRSKECLEDASVGQASSLQKCKSVASSRRSISVEMPKNSSREGVLSPMLLNNANVRMEYSNGDIDRESKRWGRAWNRTLSPLLGFKNHGRKSAHDSSHQHPGYATPNHVNFKSPLGAPPSSSSYMSSFSRSECAPDAQIQFAQ